MISYWPYILLKDLTNRQFIIHIHYDLMLQILTLSLLPTAPHPISPRAPCSSELLYIATVSSNLLLSVEERDQESDLTVNRKWWTSWYLCVDVMPAMHSCLESYQTGSNKTSGTTTAFQLSLFLEKYEAPQVINRRWNHPILCRNVITCSYIIR